MPGITDPTEAYFKDGTWGWDGSQWRKLSLVWGYSDRVAENLGETKDGAGAYAKYSTAVPSGEVHVIEYAFLYNTSGARGLVSIHLRAGAVGYVVYRNPTPVQHIPDYIIGRFTLKAGDKIYLEMNTCLDDDNIVAGIWGYSLKVAE